MTKKRFWLSGRQLFLLLLVCHTGSVLAATATTTFLVTATVASSCGVTATALTFGNYDVLTAAAVQQTNNISVTCSTGTTYTVGLNPGMGTGATVATRLMTQTSAPNTATMQYSIYQDTGHTTVWGQTIGTDTRSGTGTGTSTTFTGYGLIASGQNTLPPDSYQDTIGVTVTY